MKYETMVQFVGNISRHLLVLLAVGVLLSSGLTSAEELYVSQEAAGGTQDDARISKGSSDGGVLRISAKYLHRIRLVFPLMPISNPTLRFLHDVARKHRPGDGDLEIPLAELEQHMGSSHLVGKYCPDDWSNSCRSNPDKVITTQVSTNDRKLDASDIPKLEDRPQVQGWEGCLRDYNMVMLPETLDYKKVQVLIQNDRRLGTQLPQLPVPEVPARNPVALQIVDSNGRQPPGLAQGNFHWVGATELCLTLGVEYLWNGTETRVFKGKYARLTLPMYGQNTTRVLPVRIGVCAPDTCSEDNIVRYVGTENPDMIPYLVGQDIYRRDRNVSQIRIDFGNDFKNDPAAKGALAWIIMLVGFVIIASCYDGWGRHRVIRDRIKDNIGGVRKSDLTLKDIKDAKEFLYAKPSVGDRFETMAAGVSAYSNGRHVYTETRRSDYHVSVLDGIKGILYLWIIRSLTYAYGVIIFVTLTTENLLALQKYMDEWTTTVWLSTPFANTGCYYVSGFVAVQTFYKYFHRNDSKLSFMFVCRYLIHRWWAFMATMMGTMIIYIFYYTYLGDGPLADFNPDAENCRKNWWVMLLLMHNLVREKAMCWAWSWIFACLWQLHLFSAFILVPYVILPAAGYLVVVIAYMTHIIIDSLLWKRYVNDEGINWYFDIQMTPWCNAGPYIIGMVFALMMRNVKRQKKWHWFPILALWLLATTGILTSVFIHWDLIRSDEKTWPNWGHVSWQVLGPQMFSLCLGWVTFACWKGYGGIIGDILSWSYFRWFSNVMLTATLAMAPALIFYYLLRVKPFYIHENHIKYAFFAHLINSFLYINILSFLLTYPYSRGVMYAFSAKTRMELFLWAGHPDILDDFTGDPDKDMPLLERRLKKERRERGSTDTMDRKDGKLKDRYADT